MDDIEAALADDVSGVVIAMPAETHYDLTRRALKAGKAVFVEKPSALTDGGSGFAMLQVLGTAQRSLMLMLNSEPVSIRG